MPPRTHPLLLASLLVVAAPPVAGAAPPDGTVRAENRSLTLDEAVDLVKRRYEARVLRAEETRDGDEVIYRIRLLGPDGRVFEVRVDARSGRVE
jgi:uncharacterized membrane protein YkoI